MITVNSHGGGKSSAYMGTHWPADHEIFSLVCISDMDCRPKDPAVIKYVDAKLQKFVPDFGEFIATAEDVLTLVAMMDLEQLLGREIVWLRGMSFDDVIDKGTQTRLPSWARRHCTEKMKLLPIFIWWFQNLYNPNVKGQGKCDMRIGFRFDEFKRLERFFNLGDPCNFSIPTSCKNFGEHKQNFQHFNWRYCSFPMVHHGIIKLTVIDYWKDNGFLGGDLFEVRRQIKFPAISNCAGCFHKNEETIAAEAVLNLDIIKWFARQELKDMGTWLDRKMTYQHLIDNRYELSKEVLLEMQLTGESCDTGGCTD